MNELVPEVEDIPYASLQSIEDYIGFSPFDMRALATLLKKAQAKNCLEVGTFLGTGSTTVFSAMGVNLTCIDHWKGNINEPFFNRVCPTNDIFEICKSNIEKYDKENKIQLVSADSLAVCDQYPNNHFDLIFIDGDHTYKRVKQDIEAWLPKVRKGGIICGHDCEGQMKDFPNVDFSDEGLEKVDYIEKLEIHPGVIRAVAEIFGKKGNLYRYKKFTLKNKQRGYSTIWYYQIPKPSALSIFKWRNR